MWQLTLLLSVAVDDQRPEPGVTSGLGGLTPAYCRLMFTHSPMRQIKWRVNGSLSGGPVDSEGEQR